MNERIIDLLRRKEASPFALNGTTKGGICMDEKGRKLLTEWLGECWHEFEEVVRKNYVTHVKCKLCGNWHMGTIRAHEGKHTRTFDTWQDLGNCKEKLVEEGLWEQFFFECAQYYGVITGRVAVYTDWLITPPPVSASSW